MEKERKIQEFHFEEKKLNNPASKHIYPILRYFEYNHLPEYLQQVSKPFHDLAVQMVNEIPDGAAGPEKSAGLRKLLEAKDCFVRVNLK